MSAPLVVNTTDGTCWTLRQDTPEGGLYAPEKCTGCPSFLLASYAELAGHGIAGSADVLPVPVGPETRTLDVVEEELTGANLSLWEEEQDNARLRLALKAAQRGRRRARNELEFTEASRRRWRDGLIKETAKRKELERRVAELEAERHTTNAALSDVAVALREKQSAPAMVFRASHESIVMGHYTTAAEARKHCEAEARREHVETSVVELWWREDENTVDQPEDGEQELFEHAKLQAIPGPGRMRNTGYVVTPLEIASEYDEEADE